MKSLRFLFFALLPMMLALTTFAVSAHPDSLDSPARHKVKLPSYPSDVRALHAEAWYYACSLSRYDCIGISAPVIVYEDMSDEPGLLGRYWRGSNMVTLNEKLRGDETGMELVVLVHEMTHYLQYNRGAWEAPFTKARSCALEAEAFNVGEKVMKYVLEIYDYRMRGWDPTRAFTYGCPI